MLDLDAIKAMRWDRDLNGMSRCAEQADRAARIVPDLIAEVERLRARLVDADSVCEALYYDISEQQWKLDADDDEYPQDGDGTRHLRRWVEGRS